MTAGRTRKQDWESHFDVETAGFKIQYRSVHNVYMLTHARPPPQARVLFKAIAPLASTARGTMALPVLVLRYERASREPGDCHIRQRLTFKHPAVLQ